MGLLSQATACLTCSIGLNNENDNKSLNADRRSTMKSSALQMYPDITEVRRRKAVHHRPHRIVDIDENLVEKDTNIRKQLLFALTQNNITSHLDHKQHEAMIDIMKPENIEAEVNITTEGTLGSKMWIILDGILEISKIDGFRKQLRVEKETFESCSCIGEVALFYDAERTASVKTLSEVYCYTLTSDQFYTVMCTIGKHTRERRISFLKKVHSFKGLDLDRISKIESAMKTIEFEQGVQIIKYADIGDTLYVIESGEVTVYKNWIVGW